MSNEFSIFPNKAETDDDEEEPKPERRPRARDKKPERFLFDLFDKDKKEVEPKPILKVVEKAAEKPLLAEAEPVPEAEAPAEHLGEAEKETAFKVIAQDKLENTPEMPEAESDPETVAEEVAARAYLEAVVEHGDPDAAVAEVGSKLKADPREMAELTAPLERELRAVEAETETEEETAEEDEPQETGLVVDHAAEAETAEEEAEDLATAGTAGPPPAPPTPPTGRGAGGGAPPPRGPAPPFGVPGGPGAPGAPGVYNPNAAPQPAAANQAHVPEYDSGNPAVTALIGGIIGYLIGRRRGRIKTEKKLIPIQKKLEKQVVNLQFELQEREKKIRRVAAEKVRRQGPEVIEVFTAMAAERGAQKADLKQGRRVEKSSVEGRRRAPEANLLHTSQPEHIGHFLVAAEAKPTGRAARPTPELAERAPEELIAKKRVETLNRAELLSLSEKIIVDGSSLRQIYETHLIGERGLRRLVAEHLRGGDIKKALRLEIIEREIDFERDPALRDMAVSSGAATGTGGPQGNKTELNKLLEKASVKLADTSEEAAFFKARAEYEASQSKQQQRHKQLMDSAFITIILGLLALVIWLAVTRV